jgi:hypothetical protein
LAIDNIDILRRNGFEVTVDELAETGQGRKLQLVAQPVSKSTVFDMKGNFIDAAVFTEILKMVVFRLGRAHPPHARPSSGPYGEVL